MNRLLPNAIANLCLFLLCNIGYSSELPEMADVFLIDQQDKEIRIAEVLLSQSESAAAGLVVNMDYSIFTDHFLSMRPFKCIEGETEWFCHLPYPYETRSTISADDLTDLEYQLLFIRKTPSEFGIDAWNGLYFKITPTTEGTLLGQLLEGDLNVLASPPDDPYARPIDLNEFTGADSSRRLFPRLIIKEKTPPSP